MSPKNTNLIELNRYRNVNQKDVDNTKLFVAGKIKESELPTWAKRFKDDLSVKDNQLILGDRIVVSNQEREALMRKLIYDSKSDVAPSRDAGYYLIKKRYANISRRQWLAFLKAQRVIRKTDNAPRKAKQGGKKLSRTGELECDLFFISRKDLPDYLKKGGTDLYAVLVVCDRLTSLCYVELTGSKERKSVTPALKKAVNFFKERLSVPAAKQIWYMDGGTEFDPKFFSARKIERIVVTAGSKVEKKNSDIQRQFHRLKNAERLSSIQDGLEQATKIVNNSYNRVIKMTANEAAEKYSDKGESKKLIQEYNKHREKADEDRRKPLKVGDMVRIVMKSAKNNPFYKAYRGKTYTRDGYPVNEDNKQFYKNRELTKEFYEVMALRGKNPTKYKVDKKWYIRSRLSEPIPKMKDSGGKVIKKNGKYQYTDQASEALMRRKIADRKPKKKAKAPSKSTRAAKKKAPIKKTMVPGEKATVNAFVDLAAAITENQKVRKIINTHWKLSSKPSDKQHNDLGNRIKVLKAYGSTHAKYNKGMIKENYKNIVSAATSSERKLKKVMA